MFFYKSSWWRKHTWDAFIYQCIYQVTSLETSISERKHMFLVFSFYINVHVFSIPLRQRTGMPQSRVQCPRPWPASLCKQNLLAVKGSHSKAFHLESSLPRYGEIHVLSPCFRGTSCSSKCSFNTQLTRFSVPNLLVFIISFVCECFLQD